MAGTPRGSVRRIHKEIFTGRSIGSGFGDLIGLLLNKIAAALVFATRG
jgi:tetrahydromethanopterin S-methyltransferase subunit G